jgi:hypothetical protein
MAELPEKFWENEEFVRAVRHEVRNQMQPLTLSIEKIHAQNAEQSELLKQRSRWFEEFDEWKDSLYANGKGKITGNPGYLEKARAADDGRYERLFKEVTALKASGYLDEGREQGRKEVIKEQGEARKDKMAKIRFWVSILGALAGAGVYADYIKPLIQHLLTGK